MTSPITGQSQTAPSSSPGEHPALGNGILVGLVLLCTILPLLFFYHTPDLIVNRGMGIIMVDEYIKFAALLAGGSLIVLIATISMGRNGKLPLPPRWIGIFTIMFYAALLGSTFQCSSAMLCFQGTLEIYLLPPLLFLLLASSAFLGVSRIRLFFWGILGAGLISALIGIDQTYALTPLGNKIPHLGAGALLFNQNLAGEYLILLIPAAVVLILLEKRPHLQVIALLVSGLLLFHLVLTLARGAWVGLLVAVVVVGITAWRAMRKETALAPGATATGQRIKKALPWIAAPLALLMLFTASSSKENPYAEEFASIFTRGSPERVDIWKDSLVILKEKWMTGIGPDNYRAVINAYLRDGARHTKWNYATGVYRYPFRTHNDYYQTILELGILGFIAQIGLFATVAWFAFAGLQRTWRHRERERFLLLLASYTGFCAFAVSMFFEFPMRMPTTGAIGWILAGLTVNLGARPEELRFVTMKKGYESILASTGAVLVLLSFFLAKELFLGSVYRSHAVVGLSQKMVEPAYVWAEKATAITPWIEHVVVDKMRIDLILKRYDQAIESADFFMRYQPNIPPVHMYRAEALIRKGELLAAKQAVDVLTTRFPFIQEGWKAKEWVDKKVSELAEGRYSEESSPEK